MSYIKHGMWKTPEYRTWSSMKSRCSNANVPNYPHYGGRGITVCAEWQDSFEAFFAAIGPRPSASHSLDRIDVNGNYEPGNVRWATPTEQANNRRARTTCRKGLHELIDENIVFEGDKRRCLACRKVKFARRNKGVPTPQPCGTHGAYQRHYARGEKPCDLCRDAYNTARRERRRTQAAA